MRFGATARSRYSWRPTPSRGEEDRPRTAGAATSPARGEGPLWVQLTEKSSAKIVPWAYQPWTYTVTLVVLAPVVNGTLSCVKLDDDGVKLLVSLVPVPVTPMNA